MCMCFDSCWSGGSQSLSLSLSVSAGAAYPPPQAPPPAYSHPQQPPPPAVYGTTTNNITVCPHPFSPPPPFPPLPPPSHTHKHKHTHTHTVYIFVVGGASDACRGQACGGYKATQLCHHVSGCSLCLLLGLWTHCSSHRPPGLYHTSLCHNYRDTPHRLTQPG